MFVSMFFNSGTMWRQSLVIVIAFGLSVVVIANAVDKDHQHSPRNEKQSHGGEWIYQYTDPEPGIPQGQPIDGRFKRVFSQVFYTQCAQKHDHTPKP